MKLVIWKRRCPHCKKPIDIKISVGEIAHVDLEKEVDMETK